MKNKKDESEGNGNLEIESSKWMDQDLDRHIFNQKNEKFRKLNYLSNRHERYVKIQSSMRREYLGIENVSNYRVHRIVFENLLTEEGSPPEGNDRSLSIPFDDKMRPVWAPNGYGKTFAFKILSFLYVNPNEIWNPTQVNTPRAFWGGFIRKCSEFLNQKSSKSSAYQRPGEIYGKNREIIRKENSQPFTSFNALVSDSPVISKKLIPFVRMKIRLVGVDAEGENQVVDISLKPNWSTFEQGYTQEDEFTIRKKFWNAESLENLFYKTYPDEELKSILLGEKYYSEGSFIPPQFIESSFKFPMAEILFHKILAEDDDDEDGVEALITHVQDLIQIYSHSFSTHLQKQREGKIQQERIIFIEDWEEKLILKLRGFDFVGTSKEEQHSFLLSFIELSNKYPSMSIFFEQEDGWHIRSYEGFDLQILCTLLDLRINGVLHPSTSGLIDVDDTWDGRVSSPQLFEEFNSYFQNSPNSWRTFDTILRDTDHNCIEDESIIEAVRMLQTCYFEIPSEVNYSSESNLKSSQELMQQMLDEIRSQYDEITVNYPRIWDGEFSNHDIYLTGKVPEEGVRNFLKILQERLGGGRNILSIFLTETLGITASHSWEGILNKLNLFYDGDHSSLNKQVFDSGLETMDSVKWFQIMNYDAPGNKPLMPEDIDTFMLNFLHPDIESLSKSIWHFAEIFMNINETLDKADKTAWSAQCRFNSLKRPMKFSDPLTDIDINEEHLSFGQRSVIVSEVRLGFCISLPTRTGTDYIHPHSDFQPIADLQLDFIIDEPEIGRSEYWVNKISRRIISTSQRFEENKSIMIVSHRESLLRTFNSENRYHVMQPQETMSDEEE